MTTRLGDLRSAHAVAELATRYRSVRQATEALCEPLTTEDYVIQSMPDASPAKWHLAHTTWFFETFVLTPHRVDYQPFHPQFAVLFNSYYNAVGPRWPRQERGLLSRPTVAEVFHYRAHVDEHMAALFEPAAEKVLHRVADTIVLGLHHEQQHQELLLTDLKHALSANPLRPVYHQVAPRTGKSPALEWHSFPAGVVWLGHDGNGFAFDNELPRHRVFLDAFQLANRLVTNSEYLAFMQDGGYERPELWLSDGWAARHTQGWTAPLYWEHDADGWAAMTLTGLRLVNLDEPVCHVSYYEADAYARWAGARLPREAEWEIAATKVTGHFADAAHYHPAAAPAADDHGPIYQLYGDVWQWTASPYVAYPGYVPAKGALGEYNGKFMCNQMILRGGSCATPHSHARRSYRNFFPPEARWQFSGIRLARGERGA
jgi:ergothioneine biosynthesis protein EgtB